ncbi:MAG: Tll0287-like domain-containing protein [Pseudomonadota bacterium]
MNNKPRVFPWLVLLAAAQVWGADSRFEHSRSIVADFQQTLMGELQAAMAEGGPVQAIDVCREVAPAIAARASEASGAAVGRTALRVRNPDNAPDPAAVEVLEAFRAEVDADAAVAPERYTVHGDGSARYMRAIVLQPPCATCHGERLAPAVTEALAEHYPEDRATGFSVGALRGAFIIDWPAATAPRAEPEAPGR